MLTILLAHFPALPTARAFVHELSSRIESLRFLTPYRKGGDPANN
jgi:hypothetical protein